MTLTRVLAVGRLHGLDLIRRRLVLVLLAAVPVVIYLAVGNDADAVLLGGTLMTFSIAGPAVFVTLAGRGIDQRLALAGFGPVDLVLGRLLLLAQLGLAVAVIFGSLVLVLSSPPDPGAAAGGLVVMAVVAVALGLALGAVLPGDLEAMLAMMAVIGVQLTSSSDSLVSVAMPYHGATQLLRASAGDDIAVLPQLGHAAVWFVALMILTTVATVRRSRIHRSPLTAAAAPPPEG